jgi:hypothetical protein
VPGVGPGGEEPGGGQLAAGPVRHEGDGPHGAGGGRQEAAAARSRLDQHQQTTGSGSGTPSEIIMHTVVSESFYTSALFV